MLLVVAIVGAAIFTTVQNQANIQTTQGFTGDNIGINNFETTSNNELAVSITGKAQKPVQIKGILLKNPQTGKTTQVNSEQLTKNTIPLGESQQIDVPNVTGTNQQNQLDIQINYSIGKLDGLRSNGTIRSNLDIETPFNVISVNSLGEWNQGLFYGTSTFSKDNPARLKLGYLNGSEAGQPRETNLNNKSLIAYWRLDNGAPVADGSLKDYSGFEEDGETRGGISTGSSGILSTDSIELDGVDDYLSLPSLRPGTNFGVSAWFRTSISPGNQEDFAKVFSGETEGSQADYFIQIRPSGQIGGGVYAENGGYQGVQSGVVPDQNKWYHVVLTQNQTDITIFVNGVLESTEDSAEPKDADGFAIGQHPQGNQRFEGKIDEVRVYNRSLSAQDVEELYFAGSEADRFEGDYVSPVFTAGDDHERDWSILQVNSSVPSSIVPGASDTSVTVSFLSEDQSGHVLDSQNIDIQDGLRNYSLEVQDSRHARLHFNGSSSDPAISWQISGYKAYYK
jgi:hypothetical protein